MVYLKKCSSAWPKGKPALLDALGAQRQLAANLGFKVPISSNTVLFLSYVYLRYLEVWYNNFWAIQADNTL